MAQGLRIVVGCDDAGVDYKEMLKADLEADDRVAEVVDVGVTAEEDTAYPHIGGGRGPHGRRGQGRPRPADLRHGPGRGDQREQGARASVPSPPTTASRSSGPS